MAVTCFFFILEKMDKLTWTTVKRKVKDLLPLEINPRKISTEQVNRLKESLQKFNLAEIPIINFDNTLIGGNQRVKVLNLLGRGNEKIDVRYPNRQLSVQELKEYALTSNTHAGEWDFNILEQEFGEFDLSDFNIQIPDLDGEEQEERRRPTNQRPQAEPDKRWFVYIDCVNEKEAQKMYDELAGRGFETKVVN